MVDAGANWVGENVSPLKYLDVSARRSYCGTISVLRSPMKSSVHMWGMEDHFILLIDVLGFGPEELEVELILFNKSKVSSASSGNA